MKQKHMVIFYYTHLNKYEESLIVMVTCLLIFSGIALTHGEEKDEEKTSLWKPMQ